MAPVPAFKLTHFLAELSVDDEYGDIISNDGSLSQLVAQHEPPFSVATSARNRLKNLFVDVVPFDEHLVALPSQNYINASPIPDFSGGPGYICTQAPKCPAERNDPCATVEQFWEMVHTNNVSCVVMLCANEELDQVQYWGTVVDTPATPSQFNSNSGANANATSNMSPLSAAASVRTLSHEDSPLMLNDKEHDRHSDRSSNRSHSRSHSRSRSRSPASSDRRSSVRSDDDDSGRHAESDDGDSRYRRRRYRAGSDSERSGDGRSDGDENEDARSGSRSRESSVVSRSERGSRRLSSYESSVRSADEETRDETRSGWASSRRTSVVSAVSSQGRRDSEADVMSENEYTSNRSKSTKSTSNHSNMSPSLGARSNAGYSDYEAEDGVYVWGEFQVRALSEKIHSGGVVETIVEVSKRGGGEPRAVSHFRLKDWKDYGAAPESSFALHQLVDLLNKRHANAATDGPIVVHCRAGVGRSGTFIAIHNLFRFVKHQLEQGAGVDEIFLDIESEVRRLRSHRMYMVQTPKQYRSIYEHLGRLLPSLEKSMRRSGSLLQLDSSLNDSNDSNKVVVKKKRSASGQERDRVYV